MNPTTNLMSACNRSSQQACLVLLALACAPQLSLGQGTGKSPTVDKRQYSPYAQQAIPDRVFFGDTHLHTAYSADAGLAGNTLGPEAAYRFAKGETVVSSTGVPARLRRPLDFLVIADHAENLGLPIAIHKDDPRLLSSEWGRKFYDEAKKGTVAGMTAAYSLWMQSVIALKDPLADRQDMQATMWHELTEAAERHNAPGRFTALIGFEWTQQPNGNNLHRNVIFRDGKDKADQVVPVSAYDVRDPEKLWDWMEAYEKKTGGRVLAIPHNGNLSNGLMFDDVTLTSGKPLNRAYAERRMRLEPIYEVTQIKGDGEAHPSLSPTDEFADFETWDNGSFGPQPKSPDMLPREYAREALKRGLAYEARLGANPFKFGMIGSTDSHTSLSTAEEDNFFGKVSALEPSADPMRWNEPITGRFAQEESQRQTHRMASAGGIAAVWARDNTRAALWDAFARKEVYATTGTRLRVRVFGGYDFSVHDLGRSDFAANGYAQGVPMGGDLRRGPAGRVPTLLIQAMRDPDGANLDRIQVVKGWLDQDGKTHEKVFDVVWSGQRKPGKDGKLPAVGNTVDAQQATFANSIGAPYLAASWSDPQFDSMQRAFYYVRVLEIPTPRWTTYDAKFFGLTLPRDVPASIQERAYTSPIWYTP
ncbi:MAG: DUF3604 domain-containing protein [Steroidobacteraceae bacterium]